MRQPPFQSSYLSFFFPWQTFTILDLMSKLITKTTRFGFVWLEFFSNNGKVGFMCSKAKHNEISYESRMRKTPSGEHFEGILPITSKERFRSAQKRDSKANRPKPSSTSLPPRHLSGWNKWYLQLYHRVEKREGQIRKGNHWSQIKQQLNISFFSNVWDKKGISEFSHILWMIHCYTSTH